MSRILAVVAPASLALLSCKKDYGECGSGETCPQGRICHPTYHLCYVPDPPSVIWASPQVGETLLGTTASVAGVIDFGGAYTAEISCGRPDVWQPLSVSATGQFSAQLPLPASNGEPQPLRIRTTETGPGAGGRVTLRSIYRPVDNVPPSLSFSEPAPRPTLTPVRLVASEPMSTSAAPPQAVPLGGSDPPVPGRWNS